MKHIKSQKGYTIVELLVVTAIAGFTAIAAFTAVSGQTERNEFESAIRNFESRLLDIANDVSKGVHPGATTGCNVLSTNGALSFSGSRARGSSPECIFAGKAVKFSDPSATEQTMTFLTLASRRVRGYSAAADANRPVTDISQLSTGQIAVVPGLNDTTTLTNGIRVLSVRHVGGSTGGMVFLTSFANRGDGEVTLSGSPQIDLFGMRPITGLRMTDDIGTTPGALRVVSNYQRPNSTGVAVCVQYRSNARTAVITFGQQGSQTTTAVDLRSRTNPCN